MLSVVLKKDVPLGGEIEGKNMIRRSLCNKRVLVVLDDVDNPKQIDALAGSNDWFGEGSRIIITIRDEHLLTRRADMILEVSLLSYDEAIMLFSRHAYRKDKPVEDYEMLSHNIVSYAGGLPLALEILGCFLYDKDNEEWKSALAKLKCIPDVQVMERLKISYDGLKHDEKELFLDIACFFRRVELDKAMLVLNACNFHTCIGLKVLAQKSLIKVSDGIFEMHDLIEEMAHYIVKGEHLDNPKKHSRIWKREDVITLCAMGAATPETEVLALPDYACYERRPYVSYYDNHQPLLNVIGNMKKLRWIKWWGYPASSIFPSNFQPIKLSCLMLTSSHLKQLWEGYKLLPNLKILDLGDSWGLMRTPDFKGLPRLERLILNNCTRLEEIHPSVGYHERLVLVDMTACNKLKMFPPIIWMKKLETLNLSRCSRLQKFPDIQTNMDSLVNLHLDETGLELIPASVGQFCTNLVSLDLRSCNKLKRIEGNFRLLKSLKYLKHSGSNQLEKLAWEFFNEECCLEELSLFVSPKLPQFPCFLRKLELSFCNVGDGDMPYDMSGLLNLQVLDLSCNKFSRLHSSFSQLSCLKFLNLSCCPNLVELPDLPSSIAILIAERCESLQSVGDLSNYNWLWKVSLQRKNKLIGVERVLNSMLQRNAVEDRFMSVVLPSSLLSDPYKESKTITLQLPHNWYNDFGGFLLCADDCWEFGYCNIYIKQEVMSMDYQLDHRHEFDENPEFYKECPMVGYVPFSSLRHTSWWNPAYTLLTFRFHRFSNPKVGLVPRKSKSVNSMETPKYCSESWEDSKLCKTFVIKDHSVSEILIVWSPQIY